MLAGAGPLPGDIVAACESSGREVFIVAHKGITDPEVIGSAPHEWVHLGAVERVIALLHRLDAKEIVFAGPIKRPALTSLRLDGRALKLVAGLRKNDHASGDDKLLSLIIGELEGEGFRVVGIDSIRSEEHTSELQSQAYLVCRLLLEKKKKPSELSLL